MSLDYGLEKLGVKPEDIFWHDNICDKMINDERQELWKKQRKENGFDERETWALEYTIAIFVYPRLKWFIDNIADSFTPGSLTSEQWLKILNMMLFGFEESINDNANEPSKNREETDELFKRRCKIYNRKIKDSHLTFAMWYSYLWW